MLNNQLIKNHSTGCLFFALLIAITLPLTVNASSADSTKPIKIEAGKVVIKEKQGISYYSGKVKIAQGSRLISGETIRIYSKKNEITKIVIAGKPAFFSQLNDASEKTIARAKEMVFHVKKEILVLKKEAVLQQKDNIFRSERISYNTAKDIMMAGDKNAPANQRVKITIHPKKESKSIK